MHSTRHKTVLFEDADLENADLPEPPADPTRPRPDRALVAALLSGRTAAIRAALQRPVPQVIHLVAPSPNWALALNKEIKIAHAGVRAVTVTETKKDKNAWLVEHLQQQLVLKVHTILCTTATPDLLPAEVLGAVDLRLDLPRLDSAGVHRAIREFCGQRANGLLPEDVDKLDFPDLVLALRPGSSARDCVRRLKALGEQKRMARLVAHRMTGPRLEDIPLPAAVRGWALGCLDELNQIGAGTLQPSQLRFAVLEGPPGTGKTMIAQALARSAGWPLRMATMGDWFSTSDGHLGGVSKAIVAFFDSVLEHDNCVAFIDEIDGLPDRATLDTRDRQWWTVVVNLFIKQIDRLRSSDKNIMIIGATNHVERLDAALTRPGRMENRIHVPVPQTEDEIRAIFAFYLAPDLLESELVSLASLAQGASPAQIEGWVKQARAQARHEDREVTLDDLLTLVAPPDPRDPSDIRAAAIHEAGHAVIATELGIGVRHVTIIAEGGSGGVTRTAPIRTMLNREQLEDYVTVLMAGRAADLVLGAHGAHSGAALDLQMSTALLMRGRFEWGLYDTLGHLDPTSDAAYVFVDEAIKRLLHRALKLVTRHREEVLTLAKALETKRFIKGSEIRGILAQTGRAPANAGVVSGSPRSTTRKTPPGPS